MPDSSLPQQIGFHSPDYPASERFDNAKAAVARVAEIYAISRKFLEDAFVAHLEKGESDKRVRAYYPEISITVESHVAIDSRLSYGYVAEPGVYTTTLTAPDLFENYLIQQIGLLIENHDVPITVRASNVPMPVHFALPVSKNIETADDQMETPLRDLFDVPVLEEINDNIVNLGALLPTEEAQALAPFTALRVDYSLARLEHYTATAPAHFQNHILFTNYQFYIDEFITYGLDAIKDPSSGYVSLVLPGNQEVFAGQTPEPTAKMPQMPAYHLKAANGAGITMVNIGVGPSNAKTITDHIAVLRPHAWVMVGHCAGLRNTQELGDYVLAHAYMREDHVLDDDLPKWVPIPALAEIQIALEEAVEEVTALKGYNRKKVMRTGTVATIDNRNWELREQSGPVHRLSLSRAIALDMESATIAANGYRFRVPYGTLLCVSDKPLHGELKLPGMATAFYKQQVAQHLHIGIKAMERLRDMPLERLHSRKLRSFDETAFL